MTEQKFQTKIINYLKTEYNAYVVKVINATRAGVPDIIACIDGLFYGIEVKTSTGKATMIQKFNIESIQKAHGKAIIINYSENWKKELDNLIRK